MAVPDGSITRQRLSSAIKWLIYSGALFVLFIIQQTPHVLEFFGIKGVLVLSMAIVVAVFEGPFGGGIYGACAGVLWDCASDSFFGYYAILLMTLGVAAGLIASHRLKPGLITSVSLSAAGAFIIGFLDFFFYYAIWSYSGLWGFFATKILPAVFLTAVYSVGYFYLVRFVHRKFK